MGKNAVRKQKYGCAFSLDAYVDDLCNAAVRQYFELEDFECILDSEFRTISIYGKDYGDILMFDLRGLFATIDGAEKRPLQGLKAFLEKTIRGIDTEIARFEEQEAQDRADSGQFGVGA